MAKRELTTIPLPYYRCKQLLEEPLRLNVSGPVASLLANKKRLFTLGDVILYSEADLLRLPPFGKRRLDEVKQALSARGLRLPTQAELENTEVRFWMNFHYFRERDASSNASARLMLAAIGEMRMDHLCRRFGQGQLAEELRDWGVYRVTDLRLLPREKLPKRLADRIDHFLGRSSLFMWIHTPYGERCY